MYITLRCKDCDNIDCGIARRFIPEDSLEGCTREVNDEIAEMYSHYANEVLPFVPLYKNFKTACDTTNKIYDFLRQVYAAPLGRKIDQRGKATTSCG